MKVRFQLIGNDSKLREGDINLEELDNIINHVEPEDWLVNIDIMKNEYNLVNPSLIPYEIMINVKDRIMLFDGLCLRFARPETMETLSRLKRIGWFIDQINSNFKEIYQM